MHGTPCFAQRFQRGHENIARLLAQSVSTNVFKNVMRLFNESTIVTFKSGKTIFNGILGNPAPAPRRKAFGRSIRDGIQAPMNHRNASNTRLLHP